MDPFLLSLLCLAAVISLLVLRTPIAFALGASASAGIFVFFAWRPGEAFDAARGIGPAVSLLGSTPFDFVHNYPLSMIPLFIALGHIAYHARITTDIYDAIRVWLSRAPGGLAMASVIGCGGFSAITGSSVACASAMGRIAVPEMLRFNYDKGLATGSVAAGGTLGSLIPPSLLFVIYAIFTEQSVKTLFLAGIVPGLLSLAGYMVTIYIWARLRPGDAPRPEVSFTSAEKWAAARKTWPAILLLAIVIFGIYLGIFTPTEAAAVSAVAAAAIGFLTGRLRWSGFVKALSDTVYQTAMIFAIAIAAKIFVSFLSLTRLAPQILDAVQALDPPVYAVVLMVVVLYIVLGMFLDSIGLLVLTLPFTVPLMEGYGFDLIWFGVIVIKLLEIGLITPPIGLNVFVIQGVTSGKVALEDVFKGVSRFLVLDFVVLALLLLFPVLSLWIPGSAW